MIPSVLYCWRRESPYFLTKLAFFVRFCTIKNVLFFNKNINGKRVRQHACYRTLRYVFVFSGLRFRVVNVVVQAAALLAFHGLAHDQVAHVDDVS